MSVSNVSLECLSLMSLSLSLMSITSFQIHSTEMHLVFAGCSPEDVCEHVTLTALLCVSIAEKW